MLVYGAKRHYEIVTFPVLDYGIIAILVVCNSVSFLRILLQGSVSSVSYLALTSSLKLFTLIRFALNNDGRSSQVEIRST